MEFVHSSNRSYWIFACLARMSYVSCYPIDRLQRTKIIKGTEHVCKPLDFTLFECFCYVSEHSRIVHSHPLGSLLVDCLVSHFRCPRNVCNQLEKMQCYFIVYTLDIAHVKRINMHLLVIASNRMLIVTRTVGSTFDGNWMNIYITGSTLNQLHIKCSSQLSSLYTYIPITIWNIFHQNCEQTAVAISF